MENYTTDRKANKVVLKILKATVFLGFFACIGISYATQFAQTELAPAMALEQFVRPSVAVSTAQRTLDFSSMSYLAWMTWSSLLFFTVAIKANEYKKNNFPSPSECESE